MEEKFHFSKYNWNRQDTNMNGGWSRAWGDRKVIWFQYYNIVMDDKAKIHHFAQQFVLAAILTDPINPPLSLPKPHPNPSHQIPLNTKQQLMKEFSTLPTTTHPELLLSFGAQEDNKAEQREVAVSKELFKKQKEISPKIVKVDIQGYKKCKQKGNRVGECGEEASKRGKRVMDNSTEITETWESEKSNRNLVEIEIELPEIAEQKGTEEQKKMIREIETDIQKLIGKMKRENRIEARPSNKRSKN